MRRCMLLYGLTCILGQALALRELSAAFHGNELTHGTALAGWLLLVAIGCGGGVRLAHRLRLGVPAFAALLAIAGLLLPAALLLIRGALWMVESRTATMPSFGIILAIAMLALAPLCLTLGFFHAQACTIAMRSAARHQTAHVAATRLYIFESAGIFIGGIVFAFLLIHLLDSLTIAFAMAALNCLAAFTLWWHSNRRGLPWGWLFLFPVAVILVLIATPYTRALNFASLALRYPDRNLRASVDTPYGRVDIVDCAADETGVPAPQKKFYYNGAPAGTTQMQAAGKGVVLPALLAHPNPQRVLLIGGSATDVLDKIPDLPRLRVDCVELDPALIEIGARFLETRSDRQPASERVRMVASTDTRSFVRKQRNYYDVIIVIAPNPNSGMINRFCTYEFFLQARCALNEAGVFALQLDGAPDYMSDPQRILAASIYRTLTKAFKTVVVLPSASAIHFVATPAARANLVNGEVLKQRLAKWGHHPKWLTAAELDELTQPFHVAQVVQVLKNTPVRALNTDLRPLAYSHALRLWAETFKRSGRGMLIWALQLNLQQVVIAILGATMVLAIMLLVIPRPQAVGVAAAHAYSGMAGFGLEIILLFTFQGLCGTAYSWLSVLLATFMAGAATGAAVTERVDLSSGRIRVLIMLQLGLALLAALHVPMLHILKGLDDEMVRILIPMLNFGVGALSGALYAVSAAANTAHTSDTSRRATAAARLYAVHLAGAGIGALAVTMIIIPALGLSSACWAICVLSLTALPLLLLSDHHSDRATSA